MKYLGLWSPGLRKIFFKKCVKPYILNLRSLISKVGPSPNTKKLFFRLLLCDDDVLSTAKIILFLANYLQNSMNVFHQILLLDHYK